MPWRLNSTTFYLWTSQAGVIGKGGQENRGIAAAVGLPLPNMMIPQLEHTFSETSSPTAKVWRLTQEIFWVRIHCRQKAAKDKSRYIKSRGVPLFASNKSEQ